MITERTLRKWRREALEVDKILPSRIEPKTAIGPGMVQELSKRILRMTQELLDQHLLRRPSR